MQFHQFLGFLNPFILTWVTYEGETQVAGPGRDRSYVDRPFLRNILWLTVIRFKGRTGWSFSIFLAGADNRQNQWKQMSGNDDIRKVGTILFCRLVHYLVSTSRTLEKTQNFDNFGRKRMISIHYYVNVNILAKREWHKMNKKYNEIFLIEL